ncbi:universal stress protein [Cellulomonas sp. PhB143]|uniref:universal stress protein n=1 Tax=Cellulomonas sp. PhB143 TaxID=2485186 RepID=UPI000F494AC5|nr:universal stress protein [Cellulomonas sp. PhB143]ROS76885.1 nucleotide-binding universal stress UspA family protein [Cellulomonas sp. PhB143]
MTVLVAYNDSPQGEAALRRAVDEARRRRTTLAVLGLDPQDPAEPAPATLAAVLAEVAADGDVEAGPVTYRDPATDPADAILDAADDPAVELVVLGSRKRSPVSKFLLGSTTQRVLLDTFAPVLVVKAAS